MAEVGATHVVQGTDRTVHTRSNSFLTYNQNPEGYDPKKIMLFPGGVAATEPTKIS